MQKGFEILERIFDALVSKPIQSVGALIMLLIALPLIRRGLREKPPEKPELWRPPERLPIEVESAWFVQNVTRMQMDIDTIKDLLGVLSNQVSGVAQLVKRQGKAQTARAAKAADKAADKKAAAAKTDT